MSFAGLGILADALNWLVAVRDFSWILVMLLSPFIFLTVGVPVLGNDLANCLTEAWALPSIAFVLLCIIGWTWLDAVFDSKQVGHDPAIMHPDGGRTWYRLLLECLQRRCYVARTGKLAPEILNGHLEVINGKRYMVDQAGDVYELIPRGKIKDRANWNR